MRQKQEGKKYQSTQIKMTEETELENNNFNTVILSNKRF